MKKYMYLVNCLLLVVMAGCGSAGNQRGQEDGVASTVTEKVNADSASAESDSSDHGEVVVSGTTVHPDSDTVPSVDRAVQPARLTVRTKELMNGDLIFQTSLSAQSKAIQLATHAPYSHCGIIYKVGNDYQVFEAVEPVKLTPLNKWIARGKDGHFVIKRLKNAVEILTPAVQAKMKLAGDKFRNKHYDLYFGWSDDRIYCSELIWKIYKEAVDIEVGKTARLREFDLSNTLVKQTLQQRYGYNIPLDETVISPVAIFDSPLLLTVQSN